MTLLKSVATLTCPILKLRRQGTILHTFGYEPNELPIARHSAKTLLIIKTANDDTFNTKVPPSAKGEKNNLRIYES